MTTWKEALNAFRADRAQAEKLKETRDWMISELIKTPGVEGTGRTHKHRKEIDAYTINVEKHKINHKRKVAV